MAVQQDQFDALDDDALLLHLEQVAGRRREYLELGTRSGQWFAETWTDSGFAGKSVMFAAQGPDRRAAMLGLARLLDGKA